MDTRKAPTLYRLNNLLSMLQSYGVRVALNGKWEYARPEGLSSITSRLRTAWLVFTGKADAIIWPEEDSNV